MAGRGTTVSRDSRNKKGTRRTGGLAAEDCGDHVPSQVSGLLRVLAFCCAKSERNSHSSVRQAVERVEAEHTIGNGVLDQLRGQVVDLYVSSMVNVGSSPDQRSSAHLAPFARDRVLLRLEQQRFTVRGDCRKHASVRTDIRGSEAVLLVTEKRRNRSNAPAKLRNARGRPGGCPPERLDHAGHVNVVLCTWYETVSADEAVFAGRKAHRRPIPTT